MNITPPIKDVAVLHSVNLSGILASQFAVVSGVNGVSRTPDFRRISSRDESLAMVTDHFLGLWEEHKDRGLILFVTDSEMRGLLEDTAAHFPGLELRSTLTGRLLTDTWWACRNQVSDIVAWATHAVQEKVRKQQRTPMVVATDASKRLGDKTIGLGIATSTGVVRMGTEEFSSIKEGEFAAVAGALERWHDKASQLDILTDSLGVYRSLNRPLHLVRRRSGQEKRCRDLLRRAQEAGTPVRIHWIRGHNDHPLNEIADRAAMQARRCAQWNMPERRYAIAEGLRADLAAVLEGVDVAELIPAGNSIDQRAAIVEASAA